MKRALKKLLKKSSKELRMELARAHIIIAMLSLALIALVSLGSNQYVTFDPTMSAVCVVLLVLVTLMSISIAVTLIKCKKN